MKNLSIQAKLLVGFGVLIAFFVCMAAYAGYSAYSMNGRTSEITQDWMHSGNLVNDIFADASFIRRAEMAMVMQKDAAQAAATEKEIMARRQALHDKIGEYHQIIDSVSYDTPEEKQRDVEMLAAIENSWNSYEAAADKVSELYKAGQRDKALTMVAEDTKDEFAVFDAAIVKAIDFNKQGAEDAGKDCTNTYHDVLVSSLLLVFVALAVSLALAVYLIRNIKASVQEILRVSGQVAKGNLTEQVHITGGDEFAQIASEYNTMLKNVRTLIKTLQSNAQQVAAASEELTASAEQSAQVTQQIAQSITDVSQFTADQMTDMDKASAVAGDVAASSETAAGVIGQTMDKTKQAVQRANEGNTIVEATVAEMQQIAGTVTDSAAVIARLGERSKEIGDIVETISGIAGQTNLLALNAAIEAARAGEHGKGFSVVAEEVRKLAEQSEEATQHISTLIRSIQDETEKAVVTMDQGTKEVERGRESVGSAGKAFGEIRRVVADVEESSNTVTERIQGLQQNIRNIVSSIANVTQEARKVAAESQSVSAATEEQAAGMQEIASGSRSLAMLAQNMQEAANKFTV